MNSQVNNRQETARVWVLWIFNSKYLIQIEALSAFTCEWMLGKYCTVIQQIFNCNIASQMGYTERVLIEIYQIICWIRQPLQSVVLNSSWANFLLFPAAFHEPKSATAFTLPRQCAPIYLTTPPHPTLGAHHGYLIMRPPSWESHCCSSSNNLPNFCPRKTQLKLNFPLSLLSLPPSAPARLGST